MVMYANAIEKHFKKNQELAKHVFVDFILQMKILISGGVC